jgi:class 3 adenylate cyclase
MLNNALDPAWSGPYPASMEKKDYRLAAIVFTDIVGFSRMMEKDERGTLQLLHMHNDLIQGIVNNRGGTVIKTIGDAFMIDFRNTVDALQCAMEIQYSYMSTTRNTGNYRLYCE